MGAAVVPVPPLSSVQLGGMRAIATTIACLILPGPLYAQLWTQEAQVGGYETYAVVAPVEDETAARPLAEQHCGRYGRSASFRHMDGPRAVFDCTVERRDPRPFVGRGIY